MTRANGTFEVKLDPQPSEDHAAGATVGRMLIVKTFYGDLQASSSGQMLAARSAVDDSAGYVAMELVIGSLHGKTGSFVLQHSGSMTRSVPSLTVNVVPDSGTDELQGLTGTMLIVNANGAHSYEFDFVLFENEVTM